MERTGWRKPLNMNSLSFVRRGLRLGLWPAFQRYIVAPRIRKLPPAAIRPDPVFCVHTLLNRNDILLYEWMLRSLLHHTSANFSVQIHEDGTFTDEDVRKLKEKFPGIAILRRAVADSEMMEKLKFFPRLLKYRQSDFWALKSLDVYMLGSTKYVISIDADVLFFDNPKKLFSDDDCNFWMKDNGYWLGIPSALCEEKLHLKPLKPINTGIGRALRSVIDLSLAESFLALEDNPHGDMIFHAIFSTRHSSAQLLEETYMLEFRRGVDGIVAKHYVNPIRFWFWEEGVPRVAQALNMSLGRLLSERP